MKPSENKRRLTPSLGVGTATSIVIANMIGAGIFTTSGLLAGKLPSASIIILCWIWGGLISLSGALCYSELATRMPDSGGEYIFVTRLYHPVVGFLSGWTSVIVGFSAPLALSAKACAMYFAKGTGGDIFQGSFSENALAISIIAMFTWIHYTGTHTGSHIQNSLTLLKVILIVGLSAAGLSSLSGGESIQLAGEGNTPLNSHALGSSMVMIMFAYSGWNAASYMSEEIKDPKRNIPASLITGTIVVCILYALINTFIFKSTPYQLLAGQVPVVQVAVENAFGIASSRLLSFIIATILLSSVSALIILGPRVYYAMAKKGHFPALAGAIHPKYGVPSHAVLIQGLIAGCMVIMGSVEQLLIYIGFSLWIFPLLSVAGVFIARRKHIRDSHACKTWGYPVMQLFFILSTVYLMVFAWINSPFESCVAVVTVLLGIPVYFAWKK